MFLKSNSNSPANSATSAVVNYFKTGNFDQEKLAQAIAGAIARSINEGNNLFLGLTKRDAQNESARHQAIVSHLNNAKNIRQDTV